MFFFKNIFVFLLVAHASLTQAESSISYGVNGAASASASINIKVIVPPVTYVTKVEKNGDLLKLSVFSNNKRPSKVSFLNSQAECYIKDIEIVPQQKVGESVYEIKIPQGCDGYKLRLSTYSL